MLPKAQIFRRPLGAAPSPLRWWSILLVAMMMFAFLAPWRSRGPSFEAVAIHSKILNIEGFSRGEPTVNLKDGRNILLKIPGSGKEYVRANDSIVKQAHSETTWVYRRYPTHTEVRVYGHGDQYGANDLDFPYSALLKRYRIPNPSQP